MPVHKLMLASTHHRYFFAKCSPYTFRSAFLSDPLNDFSTGGIFEFSELPVMESKYRSTIADTERPRDFA